jgi:hypothetical protein
MPTAVDGTRGATIWEGVIDDNGLEIGNNGQSAHYWTREVHEGESVIDLTLGNRPIMKWIILADDHATVCDHEVRECEVEADRQEQADNERVVRWNLAAMKEEDLEAAEEL